MTEHSIQAAFIQWVRIAEKQDERLKLLFHPANGGARSLLTAVKMKQLGVVRGVPDVMLPVASCGFNGLAIEFKSGKGKTSEFQLEYLNLLSRQNWFVVICTDTDAAIRTVKDYLR